MAAKKTTKRVQIEAAQVQEVRTATKNLKPADVLSQIATAQVAVQTTLAGISSQINEQITLLDNVKTAVSIEEGRLKELHDIDAAAISLDDFLASVEQKKSDWTKADQERQVRWTEEAGDRQKRWQRETQEHDYITQQARQKETDAWEAEKARRTRDEQLRQETLVKGWQERETALKSQEKEVAELRTTVANIPAETKRAVDREVAVVSNSLKRDYTQQLQIAEINANNAAKIAESTISNMRSTNEQLQAQIAALQIEVKSANTRAETIAAKAVEASSGRQALEAVQRTTETIGQSNGKGR